MPVLIYSSETLIWKEKERARIRSVQMNNLRSLLCIKRMDKVLDAGIRELCGMIKGVDNRIDKIVFRWFGHMKRMEKDRIAKRVYVWNCAGSYSMGRLWKR